MDDHPNPSGDLRGEITQIQSDILNSLSVKSTMKALVFDQCLAAFNDFKEVLSEISNDLNDILEVTPGVNPRRVRLEYRDRGKFEAELKFADDVLIFSMHTDTFQFDRDHSIWKNRYVKEDPMNAYCGIISVYNFLYDSMKFNRADDVGYLVARIFVNRERAFFVEGKRQKRQMTAQFGEGILGRDEIKAIIESAVRYTLSFDLLVPPFDMVKCATVEQMNSKIDSAKMCTAKRLGFKYDSDDVLNTEEYEK